MEAFLVDSSVRRAGTAGCQVPDLTGPLGFGAIFSPHMVVLTWDRDRGWHDGRVCRRAPLPVDPAASVYHYGQAIFEGLKAYRQPGGGVALFRPYENAARLNRSAHRIAMPPLPEDLFVEAIETIVDVERDWVPEGIGRSLYLRPFMIATEPTLGVRPANQYLFTIIASPVDGFFAATTPSPCGCQRITYGQPRAAPVRRSSLGITRVACSRNSRRPSTAAAKSSGWTPLSTATSRRWAR